MALEFNKIDLSKIPVLEVPTKEETATLGGEEYTFTIRPLTGENRMRLSGSIKAEEEDSEVLQIKTLLIGGVKDLTERKYNQMLERFLANDLSTLALKVFMFTIEFEKSVLAETEEAEKELANPTTEAEAV